MELFHDTDASASGAQAPLTAQTLAAQMTYYPTLLVGLGGSGAKILLRVKKLLQERNADGLNLHRFVFLDTDLDTFSKKPNLPPVDPSEQVLIGYKEVRTLLGHPDGHAHIWDRFPQQRLSEFHIRKLAAGNGAGQIRSLGALALAISYANVYRQIKNAYDELISLKQYVDTTLDTGGATVGDRVAIYLVGSLAGGTGSGCFLDVALMTKEICTSARGDLPMLVGVFLLPDAFVEKVKNDQEQVHNIRANSYAALRELQYVLDASAPFREPIRYQYGQSQQTLMLEPGDYLFDLCYLIDYSNARGQLSRTEDLYELAAISIFQDVGSRFGASAQSFISNATTSNGVNPCPETNLKRLIGTVASSALVYPAHRVAVYSTLRVLSAVVHDYLIGTAPPVAALQNSLNAFLTAHHLDDRGATNQILDSLLVEEKGGEHLFSRYSLGSAWGQDLDRDDFVSRIESSWEAFRRRDVPTIRSIVADNRGRRLDEDQLPGSTLKAAVNEQATNLAAEHGVLAVNEWLEDLEEVVIAMRNELEEETRRWQEREQEAYQQDFSDAAKRLEDTFHLLVVGAGRVAARKQALLDLYNDRVEQELYAAARPAAIELLQMLASGIREVATEWSTLTQVLEGLYKASRKRWRNLETHKTAGGSSFVAELEVTQPGYEKRYYESQVLSSEEAFALVLQTFDGARPALFDRLRHLGSANAIGNLLSRVISAEIKPPLFETKLTEFVKEHPEEVEGSLQQKLGVLFTMCQPFWPARGVQVGMDFPEFKGLSAYPERLDQDGRPVYADLIEQWARSNEYQLLYSDRPFEIILSRRTYGARAYYLQPAAQWKTLFEERQERSKGQYMMETHAAFRAVPDLYPSDDEPIERFALGVAMGFILARGPWYYFNLARGTDANGRAVVRVLNRSGDAVNIHSLEEIPSVPAEAGEVVFEMKPFPSHPPKSRQLAQGRENALEAVRANQEYLDLIAEAFTAYHTSVGNDTLKRQLAAYGERVLAQRSVDAGDLYDLERRAIERRLAGIGR